MSTFWVGNKTSWLRDWTQQRINSANVSITKWLVQNTECTMYIRGMFSCSNALYREHVVRSINRHKVAFFGTDEFSLTALKVASISDFWKSKPIIVGFITRNGLFCATTRGRLSSCFLSLNVHLKKVFAPPEVGKSHGKKVKLSAMTLDRNISTVTIEASCCCGVFWGIRGSRSYYVIWKGMRQHAGISHHTMPCKEKGWSAWFDVRTLT